jgi:acyl carrier protein
MNEAEIYQKLAPVFQEVFDDETLAPHAKMTSNDVAAWDSLSHIRLICSVEEAFKIRFSSSETQSLENVAAFVGLIHSKLSKAA